MEALNKNLVGLALGCFFALVHVVWAFLVAVGLAKPWVSWILSLHFVKMSFTITAFNFGKALLLVIVTFIIGYLFGWVLTWVWETVKKAKK